MHVYKRQKKNVINVVVCLMLFSVFTSRTDIYALACFTLRAAVSSSSQAEKRRGDAFSRRGKTETPGGGEEACRGEKD